jgi:hypothetical protein
MKTTAEAADVRPLCVSVPSLTRRMGAVRACCFRQGPATPEVTPRDAALRQQRPIRVP